MVKAIIDIDKHTNKVLNLVKVRFDLKDKSRAIEVMAGQYEDEFLEPQLRPEFVAKAMKIKKEKFVKVGSLEEFRNRYGIS